MSSLPVPAPGATALRRANHRLAGLVVALVVAGCAAGGLPTPPPTATQAPALTAGPTAAPTTTASRSPDPTPSPIQRSRPPEASLRGTGGPRVTGMLGSWVWGDAGSDAPWLAPPPDLALVAPGPYALTFEPGQDVTSWTAGWAPVADGTAGPRAGGERGGKGAVEVHGPDRPGTWSLQVDVRFGEGRHAAWYWRLEVAP